MYLTKLTTFIKIHRGLYKEKANLRRTISSETEKTGITFSVLFTLWYILNGITRMLSYVGLFYVFYEVFIAFRPSKTFYIAFLPCIPYVMLPTVGMKLHFFYLNLYTIILSSFIFISILKKD